MAQGTLILPTTGIVTGLQLVTYINAALQNVSSNASGNTDPSTLSGGVAAYSLWLDTSVSPATVRMRNAANNGWLAIGDATQANWGLVKRTGDTMTGDLLVNSTGQVKVPAGTTAQRPASPTAGSFRYNSSIGQFEGYNGSAWGAVGAGAKGGGSNQVFFENDQTVTSNYTITSGKNAVSAGDIFIDSGVTVTVPTGSNWVIV